MTNVRKTITLKILQMNVIIIINGYFNIYVGVRINETNKLKFAHIFYLNDISNPETEEHKNSNLLNLEISDKLFDGNVQIRDAYLYGKYFQQKYQKFYKFLSKDYTPKEIRIESDQDSTQVLAAYSLGMGLLSKLNENNLAELISKRKLNSQKQKKNSSPLENMAMIAKLQKEEPNKVAPKRNLLKNNINSNGFDAVNEFENNIDNIKFFDKYETIPKRLTSNDYIPIIPIHNSKNGNSKEYYMENLLSCAGALGIMSTNQKQKKDLIDFYISDFKNNTKIDYLLNDNTTKIDYKNLFQIAQEYLTYITANNIKTALNNTLIDFFRNYTEFSVNEIIFGDEYSYLTRLVTTVTLDGMIKNFDNVIKSENKAIFKVLNKFKKTGKLDLNLLKNNYKLNLVVTDKNIFWGLITFVQKLIKKHIDLPLASSSFQIEIFKNTKLFDAKSFLIENEKFYNEQMSAEASDLEKFQAIKQHNYVNTKKLELYVSNPDLWIIKIYYNQDMVYTSNYHEFKNIVEKSIIDKEVVKEFCLGNQNNLLFTVSIILVAVIGFLILSLICINMICLK